MRRSMTAQPSSPARADSLRTMVVVAVIVITVLITKPGPPLVYGCGAVLLAVAEAHRQILRGRR